LGKDVDAQNGKEKDGIFSAVRMEGGTLAIIGMHTC